MQDVRLASDAAELARSSIRQVIYETREEYHVIAGPSLDHRDDVERLFVASGVGYVTKLLNTEEALATESGQRERVQEYFKLREKMVRPPVKMTVSLSALNVN